MKIPFKATIRNIGNSYMVTVPKNMVGSELKEDGTYWFSVDTETKTENPSKGEQ